MTMAELPLIAVTTGEPAGIGPELSMLLASEQWPARLVLIGDHDLLQARAAVTGTALALEPFDPGRDDQRVSCLHVPLARAARAGALNPANASYVLQTLEVACDGCLAGDFAAMVTAPIHKGVINDAGTEFSGHTEFLAERTAADEVLMVLAAGELRVALATTHIPLRLVSDAISQPLIERKLHLLHHRLRDQLGIAEPRVLVCGLNPHAGEGGHLGHEDDAIIQPAVSTAQAAGINAVGPLPADTAFTKRTLSGVDAVLAMYHDQGLPVLKYAGFGGAVNITLGLPIIRTSVDHGTALDLAGNGQADVGSLQAALMTALEMAAIA